MFGPNPTHGVGIVVLVLGQPELTLFANHVKDLTVEDSQRPPSMNQTTGNTMTLLLTSPAP